MTRRPPALVLYSLCLTFLAAFLVLCFVVQTPARNAPLIPANFPHEEDKHDVVAQGDYLLGVGKADITG
jgi:hypothetical protein